MNHVDPTITHISLCTGYGGLDLGIRQVIGDRLRTVAYSEIEAFACELLLSRMEGGQLDAAPIWPDLRTFPWEEFSGISILSGGFPCQPFSAAGVRAADTDPRHLFPYILDGIRRSGPSVVFLENVEGIVSAKLQGDGWSDPAGTPVLLHVLRELERVGYRAEAGLFSASVDAGAPHQRKRVFILAHRLGAGLEGWLPRGPHPQREALDGHLGCGSPSLSGGGHPWPARPGEEQHDWEPPRVLLDDSDCGGRLGDVAESAAEPDRHGAQDGLPREASPVGNPKRRGRQSWNGGQQETEVTRAGCKSGRGRLSGEGQVEPEVLRSPHGTADRLAYAELCTSCDSRWDELRLAGNGVVPQCAAVAFRSLLDKVITPYTMTH